MVDLSKDIISKEEIRKAMQRGADVLANTVKETLGPKGRNVVIEMVMAFQLLPKTVFR